jgi:hypothetical protein
MDEILYETVFENKRPEWVHLMDNGVKKLADLAPGQSITFTATDPGKTFARWKKIVYEADGGTTLYDNPAWKMPDLQPGQFVVEVINEAGADPERLECNGQYFSCYRGIPRYLYPDVMCRPLIRFSEIRLRKVLTKRPDPLNPNYLEQVWRVEKVKKLRPKKDLELIKRMLIERGVNGREFMREIDEAIEAAA